jgi:hypothetical protein
MNIQLTLQIFSDDDNDEKSCLGMIIVEVYNHFGEMSVTRWGPLSSCPDNSDAVDLVSQNSKNVIEKNNGTLIDENSESNVSNPSGTQSEMVDENEEQNNAITLEEDFIDLEGLDSHETDDYNSKEAADEGIDFSYEPDVDEKEEEDNS